MGAPTLAMARELSKVSAVAARAQMVGLMAGPWQYHQWGVQERWRLTPPHPTPHHPPNKNYFAHMAIEVVLTRWKCAGKWCATFWDPCLANLVALCRTELSNLNFSDILGCWVSHFITKWSLDPQLGPRIFLNS